MKPKYKTINELVAAVRSGEVKEENLEVHMDNDGSYVHDEAACAEGDSDGLLFEGDGYYDTEPLWKALFPKAEVEWV